jgi:hypothetical protein
MRTPAFPNPPNSLPRAASVRAAVDAERTRGAAADLVVGVKDTTLPASMAPV